MGGVLSLPAQHFLILRGIAGWTERAAAEIVQPVTADEVQEALTEHSETEGYIGDWWVGQCKIHPPVSCLRVKWFENRDFNYYYYRRNRRNTTAFRPWIRAVTPLTNPPDTPPLDILQYLKYSHP